MKPKKKFSVFAYFVFAFTIFVIVIGISLICFGPQLLRYLIKVIFILTPNSRVFNIWEKPPFEIATNFYFFNWTNPEDIYNHSVKPKFKQIGPYKFLESQRKANIVWNSNGTVTFNRLKFWRHIDEKDAGNLQDNVTTVNPIGLTTAHMSRTWKYLTRKTVSLALLQLAPNINMTHTVSQLLFEGYPDTLMKIAKTFPFFADQDLPKWDRFGWFYERNGSSFLDGTFNMGTGKNSSFGEIHRWNYWSKTPYFENKCGEVGNSYLDVFEPSGNKASINIFSPDACRTVRLQYAEKTEVDGVIGNKYVAGDYMFDNGTLYPENKCFCSGECLPAGVFNVSSCRFGTPAFISLPHFYKADKYYTNLIEGMEPDENKHAFFVTLEPTTGVPLEIYARLQLNLLLQPVPDVSMYEKAPRVFFPVIWYEQKLKMPQEQISILKFLLSVPLKCSLIGIIVTFLGLLLSGFAFYKYCDMNMFTKKSDKYFRQQESTPLKKL